MNIGKHIESLLKRYPSVFVKGLGVFKRIHQSAKYDSSRNVYLPPLTLIEFEYFETDGYDFVSYIQDLDQSTLSDAEAKLENIVSNILDSVNQNGEESLDGLGVFESFGNAFIFKPLDLNGFTYEEVESNFAENYSSSIQNTEIVTEPILDAALIERDLVDIELTTDSSELDKDKVVELTADSSELASGDVEVSVDIEENEHIAIVDSSATESETSLIDEIDTRIVSEEVLLSEPQLDSDNNKAESPSYVPITPNSKNVFVFEHRPLDLGDEEYSNDGRSYIYGVLAALSVLILGGIYYYYAIHTNGIVIDPKVGPKSDIAAVNLSIDTALVDSTLDTVSTLVKADTVSKKAVVEPVATKASVEPVSKEKTVKHKYTIVIGSHMDLASAKAEAEKYNKAGHKSVRVLMPNVEKNKKRVVWDTYATKEQRDSALRVVRDRYKSDAWGSDI